MINSWLNQTERLGHKYKFAIIDINEQMKINDDVKNYLALSLLQQFRDIRHLKRMFEHEPKSKLISHVQNNIFPAIDTSVALKIRQLNKNVRQGDWGEVLTSCVALDMRRVNAPVRKLRYKLNKEKSLLGIDVLAFEEDVSKNLIKAILYESKTRITYKKKIGIEAYESIYNNSSKAFADMLNFISNFYYEKEDFEMSDKYDALIKEPNSINMDYHSFIIMEKGLWKSDILDCLDDEIVKFDDVYINILLIDNMKNLIDETYRRVEKIAEEVVYGK
ncbi:Hachiman antiphage defense system protein HamA [Lacrimispora sp.]|uniref:Hachiman antiphage defense system protein HamA n=1 Tax=Lacrimispora sp. TaxID=2719234 RepID=UPI0032E4CF25